MKNQVVLYVVIFVLGAGLIFSLGYIMNLKNIDRNIRLFEEGRPPTPPPQPDIVLDCGETYPPIEISGLGGEQTTAQCDSEDPDFNMCQEDCGFVASPGTKYYQAGQQILEQAIAEALSICENDNSIPSVGCECDSCETIIDTQCEISFSMVVGEWIGGVCVISAPAFAEGTTTLSCSEELCEDDDGNGGPPNPGEPVGNPDDSGNQGRRP